MSRTKAASSVPDASQSADLPKATAVSNRQQTALVTLGRMTVAMPDGMRLAQDGAALVAETLDADFYAVAEVTADGKTLVNHFGINTRTREADENLQEYRTANLRGQSLMAYALAARHPVIVDDLVSDNRFEDLYLRSKNVRSALANPLYFQQQPFGTIAVLSRQPQAFGHDDVLFVEMISHQIVTAMARQRSDRALAAEQRFTAALLQAVDALVLVLDGTGRIVRINGACKAITGFAQREAVARPLGSALLVPEEAGMVKALLDKLSDDVPEIDFESFILTKGGDRRRIAWSFARLREGSEVQLIGTGIDISALRQTEEELRKMQKMASEATRQLNEILGQINRGEIPAAGSAPVTLAHQPFKVVNDGPNGERRDRPRRSYPYIQLFAPIQNGVLPHRSSFREIRCREIAAGGFSYLASSKPTFESIVVAFGVAPALTYVTARIVHVTALQRPGKQMYVVGCAYTGRADY